jgi:hypothetical protein
VFKFTPVIFVWAFNACCEEGDSCLDISSALFAEEQELGDCVMEGLGLRFWQEFGLAFLAYGEEVIRRWGCAGCSDGLGEVGEYF